MTKKTLDGPLVISTMKNEGPYIVEWIAYHRVIGFSDFLIYTNDCEDGTVEVLDRLTEMGIVQHERNEVLLRGPHKSALKYAKAHELTARAHWIYIADIDEFLNIHVGDGSVQALIDHAPDADAIPVTWRLFSHDDQITYKDQLLTETLTDAELSLEDGGTGDRFVKSLFHGPDRLDRLGLHGPVVAADHEADFTWIAPDGRVLGKNDNLTRPASAFGYEAAQVNHYAVRSIDGYLVKRDRGRANHFRQTLGTDYWQRMCKGGKRDLTIHRYMDALKAEYARLMQDQTLAKLHQSSVAWHKAKITELTQLDDFAELRTALLKLSEARDHQRAIDPAEIAAAKKAAVRTAKKVTRSKASAKQIQKLIASLRTALETIEPTEAALRSDELLDRLETGLFGPSARK